jgi:hypothetical protein
VSCRPLKTPTKASTLRCFVRWTCNTLSLLFVCSIVAESSPPPSRGSEAICGFTSNYRYCDADKIKQGLSVDMFIGDAQAGQPVNLRFYVNRKPGDFPLDDLQVEHERLIHVIGVRDDLGEFFHIHPLKTGPGTWLVTHTFTNGGNYKIWCDVKYQSVSYGIAHPPLTVSGKIGATGTPLEVKEHATVAGYDIALTHSEPLAIGKTNVLQFVIRDGKGNPIQTENYLGAPMHLVLIRDDLSVYLHAHPEHREFVDSIDPIRFFELFPQPGTYKLFAQFRPKGSTLPQDDAILAEFCVKVGTPGEVSARTGR